MSRAFLFHWNRSEAAALAVEVRNLGWQVELEAEDGARGSTRVLAEPPDAILISLSRLPSHGRQTALYLRTTKVGKTLPIIFFGGGGGPLEKTKAKVSDATFTSWDRLEGVLARIPRGGVRSRGRTTAGARDQGRRARDAK